MQFQIAINIAINGTCASGKSLVGKILAKKLKYKLIDSSFFYQYFAERFYLNNTIQINEIHLFKNEIIARPAYYLPEIEFYLQKKESQEKLQNGFRNFKNSRNSKYN
ncbi:hypothetical protein F8M41_026182 [Gigaspora margarita]|uniref:(d)CMP kinase n=1 Tax=Gigaspora margarita TaxID=4874 RepID=A0A8H4ABA3_GIGMA|nr:hypothetical protein F8M41_026182 [Gigaspora margarita]